MRKHHANSTAHCGGNDRSRIEHLEPIRYTNIQQERKDRQNVVRQNIYFHLGQNSKAKKLPTPTQR